MIPFIRLGDRCLYDLDAAMAAVRARTIGGQRGRRGRIAGGVKYIYKWVDRSGVTQYSAAPPPPGIAATDICPMPPPSADAASQAKAEAQRMIDDANRCVAELLREQEQKRVEAETERSRIDARLRSCANARVQLFTLAFGVPVYRYNDRGERVYLEDSARDAEVARLRRELATDCSSAASTQAAQDAATRQRLVDSFRARDCSAARDYLRDVEANGSRIPSTEVERARREATLACTDVPQSSPTDWLGLKKVVRN